MLDVGDRWTGQTACLLQKALRLSNDAYARHLGIGARTVAAWHQMPERTPNSDMQQILTAALEKAPLAGRNRFAAALQSTRDATDQHPDPAQSTAGTAHTLTVAIAIVRDGPRVLLVQRRGHAGEGDSWQFPAGMVKPGLSPRTIAVRETFAETGIKLRSRGHNRQQGSSRHERFCEYIMCDYLSGEAENRDVGENVSVTWTTTTRLTQFIPADRIYPPVLTALEVRT